MERDRERWKQERDRETEGDSHGQGQREAQGRGGQRRTEPPPPAPFLPITCLPLSVNYHESSSQKQLYISLSSNLGEKKKAFISHPGLEYLKLRPREEEQRPSVLHLTGRFWLGGC